jgi:hypothetical protein
MTNPALQQVIENIYESIRNDNENLDQHIAALKAAIAPKKNVTVDPLRLVENNRQGRRLMQAYFKKHGVIVEFG